MLKCYQNESHWNEAVCAANKCDIMNVAMPKHDFGLAPGVQLYGVVQPWRKKQITTILCEYTHKHLFSHPTIFGCNATKESVLNLPWIKTARTFFQGCISRRCAMLNDNPKIEFCTVCIPTRDPRKSHMEASAEINIFSSGDTHYMKHFSLLFTHQMQGIVNMLSVTSCQQRKACISFKTNYYISSAIVSYFIVYRAPFHNTNIVLFYFIAKWTPHCNRHNFTIVILFYNNVALHLVYAI